MVSLVSELSVPNIPELIVRTTGLTLEPMVQVQQSDERAAFSERLRKSIPAAGFPERGAAIRIAKQMGISERAVGKWLNGDAMPDTKRLELLSRLLGVTAEWLLTGRNHSQLSPALPIVHPDMVPVVDLATLSDADRGDDFSPAMMAVAWTICPVKHGTRTFAFRMTDDSMSSTSAQSIPKGFFVWVDPDRTDIEHDRPVLAQLAGGQLVVAQYMSQAGRQWLHLLNPAYPPLAGAFTIVGRIIFKGEET